MKKLILLAIPVLLLTGCNSNSFDDRANYLQDDLYWVGTDKETCVQYIVESHGLSVRLNADGSPMLDEECLKEVEE